MNLLLEFPVAASLSACLLQYGSAWRALGKGRRDAPPADDGDLPAVSILKPLKGVDDRLLDNLENFCRDVLAAGLWFSAFFSRNVEWRGRTLRITRGSRLVPVGVAQPMEPAVEAAR